MKIQRLLIALTLVNLTLLAFLLAQARTAAADTAPVLRGSGLEIIDDQGRVRASIKLHPASAAGGKTYSESVVLRLIDPDGRPAVKLAASAEEAGIALVGKGQGTYAQLGADTESSLRLTNKDGRRRVMTP
ncbi:MAG TPA: hypothetical protein VMS53_07320 [Burkholderiales bacterium]|nr:hypothetical protein [Burkholderiales bacterium]